MLDLINRLYARLAARDEEGQGMVEYGLIIALVAIVVSACSSAIGGPTQTTVQVGYDEFAQTKNVVKQITVNPGSELVVNVPSNPSTGYNWTDPALGTAGVLTQSDGKYVAPTGGAVGTAGTQVWTFKASAKGITTVKADYSRPWEGGEKSEWTFQLTVAVE